ncbi:MAG: amidohydrolase family protein [Thermoguttaceae bacterium]
MYTSPRSYSIGASQILTMAGSSHMGSSRAVSSHTGPSHTGPSIAGSSHTGSSHTGSILENQFVNIENGIIESITSKPMQKVVHQLPPRHLLIPGLINMHTHLDLSQLTEPLAPHISFEHWIQRLLRFRGDSKYRAFTGLKKGFLRPEISKGTAAVADVVPPQLEKLPDLIEKCELKSMTKWCRFTEMIAWTPEKAQQILSQMPSISVTETKKKAKSTTNVVCTEESFERPFGFSPHAPYTICGQLLEALVRLQVPLMIHLAETPEEIELLRHQRGALLDFMRHADSEYDPKKVLIGNKPLDYLTLLANSPRVLVVHGNYLDDAELRFLSSHRENMGIVYCPRSHAFFGHSPYPLRKMLDLGVRVFLGTDSCASSPDLSLGREIEWCLKYHPNICVETLVSMGTNDAAKFLGLQNEMGSIESGKVGKQASIKLPL